MSEDKIPPALKAAADELVICENALAEAREALGFGDQPIPTEPAEKSKRITEFRQARERLDEAQERFEKAKKEHQINA